MTIAFLGPNLRELAEMAPQTARVGTLFLRHRVLVTEGAIHAFQRAAFIEHLNRLRELQGRAPMRSDEVEREFEESVDLFLDQAEILIRPDPRNMHLAFEADELLQTLVSKRQIRFMHAIDPVVRQAIRQRGECWRISPLPRSPRQMKRLIEESKVAIGEQRIFFYSRASGTRHLTFHEFAGIEKLPPADLARQLQEIADHAVARNRLGNPEVDFFGADPLRFNARDLVGLRFRELSEADLLARYRELRDHFREAVPADLRADDPRVECWRNRIVSALVNQGSDTVSEEILRGLSPEFFLQIEWLAGGRFEEGEFLVDTISDEAGAHPEDADLQRLCDRKARGFIFNFIREYGDLEYVNVGRVAHSLNTRRPLDDGRRDVFIAELKPRDAEPIVRFIRILKWGIREHLDEGRDLLQAMLQTEEYVDYVLDRRLGCKQLGMNLPARITIHRVPEEYNGKQEAFRGQIIHAPYGERDYIPGIATDKLPINRYTRPGYAPRLARLLGKAAASNIIVGRTYDKGNTVVFDDGDEVVTEDEQGLPKEVVVGDHSGAFGEYHRPLVTFAKDYAKPVNNRVPFVPNPREFAETYVAEFRDACRHLQNAYRKRRRAFDSLFKHCHYDPHGSFAYRWEQVLKRLDDTDVDALVEVVRKHITVLGGEKAGGAASPTTGESPAMQA